MVLYHGIPAAWKDGRERNTSSHLSPDCYRNVTSDQWPAHAPWLPTMLHCTFRLLDKVSPSFMNLLFNFAFCWWMPTNSSLGREGFIWGLCFSTTVHHGGNWARAQAGTEAGIRKERCLTSLLSASAQLASLCNPRQGYFLVTPSLSLPGLWRRKEKASTYKPGWIFSRNSQLTPSSGTS